MVRPASGVMPLPVSKVTCGLPAASSTTLICAVSVGGATTVGVKVAAILQLPPTASVTPQVVEKAKSAAFVPLTPMLPMLRIAVPGLFSTAVKGGLVAPTAVSGNASEAVSTACDATPLQAMGLTLGEVGPF